jgi:hypothetical protein
MYIFLKNHYHKRYHGVYQHAKKLFIFDLALLGLALIMMGSSTFLFFWKPTLTALIDISISLGMDRIKSGEQVRLTVDYTNHSKQNLKDVSLGLRLPKGFIVDRTQTSADIFSNESTFSSLKEIAAGASGQVDIHGQFWTEPKTEVHFIANLSYRPENKKGREQKLSSLISSIFSSVLTDTFEASPTAFANAAIPFTYTLQNTSNRTIHNISLRHTLGENAIAENDLSNISLPAGTTKVITGKIIAPNKSGTYTYTITPLITANNSPIAQSATTYKLEVQSPQIISSAQIINRSAFAEPGQILPVEIIWQNKSNFPLSNLTLHLKSNLNGVIDWKKTAIENGAKTEANSLYFDSSSRTSLSSGNPQNSDRFTINLYLLPTFGITKTENPTLEIYPVLQAGNSENTAENFSQEGSRTGIPLATEVKFKSVEARYYTAEGDQLGRGPLPPQVGKTTKYWIFIHITNGTNAIQNAKFGTSLPAGVELTGKQSTTIGPHLQYAASDRSLTWEYYELPANSQTGLYFEVAITPTAAQIGKNIQLTNNLTFSATDAFTNKKFNISHGALYNTLNKNDRGFDLGSKITP